MFSYPPPINQLNKNDKSGLSQALDIRWTDRDYFSI
jgi:hypothetical protein